MDTKRVIIAIALSVIVLIAYQYFFMPKPQPRPVPPVGEQQPVSAQSGTGQEPKEAAPTSAKTPTTSGVSGVDLEKDIKETPEIQDPTLEAVKENIAGLDQQEIVVETDLFKAVFTSKGGGMISFTLKKYNDDLKQPLDLISSKVKDKFGPNSLEIYPFYFSPFVRDKDLRKTYLDLNRQIFLYEGDSPVIVTNDQNSTKEIVFKYANVEQNVSVIKRFIFSKASYVFQVDCQITKNGKEIDAPVLFGPDLENNASQDRIMQAQLRVGTYNGQKVTEKIFSGEKSTEFQELVGAQFEWAAYDTNYFAAIFKTTSPISYWLYKTKPPENSKEKPKLYSYIIVDKPSQVFLGPKDEEVLDSIEKTYSFKDVSKVVSYGWLFIGSIAKIMLKGIIFIYGFIPNYGWALVIFTIFIKILLFPLTYASSVSMAKMQTLQPKLKAIKSRYKNLRDPQQRRKMNEETMALYREEKVNPASGCLPLLLQMPILFAFFRLLPISINFRHEAWMLWITDLSVKDPVYVLPILMGVTQIIVSKMSPTTADSSQKKLMYIMPVVFVILFLNYSSGLNLYWFISNLLQVGQQYIINKKIFKEKKEEDRQKRALKRKKWGRSK